MTKTALANPFILIDGSSWLHRAYHALPPFSNSKGVPTSAMLGMCNMLRRLLADYQPQRIAVVLDTGGETFRHRLDPNYKANRPPIPDELRLQYARVGELIEAMGLPLLGIRDVEADDVIGTLSRQAEAEQHNVLIVTSDKDLAQLVGPYVQLLDTMKNRVTDRAGVIEKFGVPPERIIDFLALVGDTSDNIPGVPKCGPKTAAKWLNEFGDLETLMRRADEVGGKVGEYLRASLEQLPKSQQLATVKCDVALPQPWDGYQRQDADLPALRALLLEFEFRRWLDELDSDAGASAAAPTHNATLHTDTAPVAPQPADNAPSDYRCIVDEAEFKQLLSALQAAELICLDCETDALDAHQAGLVGLSFAVAPGTAWYLPLRHDYMGAPRQLDFDAVIAALKPILEDPQRPKLGQHIKYDCEVLARHGIQVQGIAHDSMLESYVFNAVASRHDMDSLAATYLGRQTIKFEDVAGKGKHQLSFNQIELERAAPYAAEDADITLQLHQAIYPQLAAQAGPLEVYRDIEVPLIPVLTAIESHGVLIDAGLLATASREMAARMVALEAQAHEAAGGAFNLNSPVQLKAILFDQLGLPVISKTPKGQPSTNESVLEQLADEHALPRLILEWRGLAKLRSTYSERLPEQINPRTGRVHTSYHQAVAATGRLSSSDPNLQNIPVRSTEGRRIRQAFIAPPGYTIASIDYSQIELRLMAHFSQDQRLLQAFHEGQDIHRATASEVFGSALEDVSTEQRRAAKAINFGLIYGMSAFGLARQLGIAREEAAAYLKRFFERYPGVQQFMETTKAQAHERGYVETLAGRRLYLPMINDRNGQRRQAAERVAINAPLQGTAADLIKRAMIDVHYWLQQNAADAHMIMQVHDELVFELPSERAPELAEQLTQRMCNIARLSVPLEAEAGLGDNWDAAH